MFISIKSTFNISNIYIFTWQVTTWWCAAAADIIRSDIPAGISRNPSNDAVPIIPMIIFCSSVRWGRAEHPLVSTASLRFREIFVFVSLAYDNHFFFKTLLLFLNGQTKRRWFSLKSPPKHAFKLSTKNEYNRIFLK